MLAREEPTGKVGKCSLGLRRRNFVAGGLAASLLAASGCARFSPERMPRLFRDSRISKSAHLSVEMIGEGADVVLVPGLGASRAVWLDLAQRLRNRYRLHLVNVAGFAGEAPRSNVSGNIIFSIANDIHRYAKFSRLRSPSIVGHSMGGTIALLLASDFPGCFARAMIVEALPFTGVMFGGPSANVDSMRSTARLELWESWLFYDSAARAEAQLMSNVPSTVTKVLEWKMASNHSVVGRSLYEMLTLDLRPKMSKIKSPLMLVYSDGSRGPGGDPLTPIFVSEYSALGSTTMLQIVGSSHFVMLDQPERFFHAAQVFLAG